MPTLLQDSVVICLDFLRSAECYYGVDNSLERSVYRLSRVIYVEEISEAGLHARVLLTSLIDNLVGFSRCQNSAHACGARRSEAIQSLILPEAGRHGTWMSTRYFAHVITNKRFACVSSLHISEREILPIAYNT